MSQLEQINLMDQLKDVICKIKLIHYFIETQIPDHSIPLDFDEVQWGFCLILTDIEKSLEEIKSNMYKEP